MKCLLLTIALNYAIITFAILKTEIYVPAGRAADCLRFLAMNTLKTPLGKVRY